MDRGARWGIVHGVAKSRTRLSNYNTFAGIQLLPTPGLSKGRGGMLICAQEP